MSVKNCANCRFYDVPKENHPGICRRYPPTVNTDGPDLFPMPDPAGWCGEWKAQPSERKPKTKKPIQDRILAAIRRAGPNGLTATQINSSFSRDGDAKLRAHVLGSLMVLNLIEHVRTPTGGVSYRPLGNP